MKYFAFFFFVIFFVNGVYCKPPVCNVTSYEYQGINFMEHNHTMRIQLARHKHPLDQLMRSPIYKLGLLNEWFEKPKPNNRTNDTIRLYRYLNNEFYGKVVVGHPGQTLNVAFDTTWVYTWLLSSRCSGLEEMGCFFHNKYNHDKSSEYKADGTKFSVSTDGIEMSGFYSYDNISITHSNVTGFRFIEMTHVPRTFAFNKADGVVGLGWGSGSGYKTFFDTLVEQKKIKNPVFSIYVNRNHQSSAGGDITLGFADGRHIKVEYVDGEYVCDKIVYLKADSSPYWQFKMDKVILVNNTKNTYSFCQNKLPDGSVGCKAIIDSSSNSIVGPATEMKAILDKIGANKLFMGYYTVDCNTIDQLPHFEFVIGGKNFTLKGFNYITKMTFKAVSVCVTAFQPAENEQEDQRWILGGAFLSEVYTIYDTNKHVIGLVRAA